MTMPVSINSNIKAGMCPHGVPQSSCPICSKQNAVGMGGGSHAGSMRKSNEWSYQKCYVAGLEIKAAINRKEAAQTFFEKQFQNALSINKNLSNLSEKIASFIQNIKIPFVQNSMQFIFNTVISPVFRAVSQISKFVEKFSEFQQKAVNLIFSTGEKLVNILGEVKNFVERNIVDNFKKKAKKFMSFCLSVIEDENYQNDDTLAVFKSRELRKYNKKLLKKRNNNEHRTQKHK